MALREEEIPLNQQEPAPQGGGGGKRVLDRSVFLVVTTILGIVCTFLFISLQRVSAQLRREQNEIEELEDVIQHEQKGEIEHLAEKVEQERKMTVYHLAGTFVLVGGLITMFHMRAHLRKMNQPSVQRRILAVLMMCPIYSVTSFLSLVFPVLSEYLAIIKDCYEAYVIYQFLGFLIAVLGKGNREAVVDLLARHVDHLKPPLRCMNCFYYPNPKDSDRAMANAVLLECQIFAMQFVFFRPVLSILIFVLDMLNNGELLPTWDLMSPRFYCVMIQNLSVFTAFTGLLRFYHAVHEYIEWCSPFPKFLCIKGVIFMTFWQGLVISFLANAAGSDDDDDYDPREWSDQVQNLLICLEMLFFSIAHYFVFPTDEWEEGYIRKKSNMKFGDSIALDDFMSDVKMVMETSRSSARAHRADRADKNDYASMSSSTIQSDTSKGLDNEERLNSIHELDPDEEATK